MKTINLILLFSLFCFFSCSPSKENDDNSEELKQECDVGDPLTELPWLTEIIDEFENGAETSFYKPHARIYQCTCKSGIGFLLEMCVECPDVKYSFRNCEGEILCVCHEFFGENSCSEFDIDFDNKKLIWERTEMHYPVEIPFTEYLFYVGASPGSLPIAGTACRWVNIYYVGYYNVRITVINSNEELEGYFNCLDGDHLNIDFSTHTLLLVNGATNKDILQLSILQLLQFSAIDYQLLINIQLSDAKDFKYWAAALIVNKLNKKSNIKINVIN